MDNEDVHDNDLIDFGDVDARLFPNLDQSNPKFPVTRKWLMAQWKITSIILEAYEDILNNIVQQQIKKASKASIKIGQMHEYSKMCRVIMRFVSEKDAEHAAKLFGKLEINGNNIEVFHLERDEKQLESLPDDDAPAVILSNIRKNMPVEELEKLFPIARIITMVKDRDGNPQGVARLEYKAVAHARKAYNEHKDMLIDDKKVSMHLVRKILPVGGVKTAPKRKTDAVAGKDSGGATVQKRRQIDTPASGRGRGTGTAAAGRGRGAGTSVGGRGRGMGSSTGGFGGGTARSAGWTSGGGGHGMGFQDSGRGGRGFAIEGPPQLMDESAFPADRYNSYDNYRDFGSDRMMGQGEGFRGGRMGGEADRMMGQGEGFRSGRMGGEADRMMMGQGEGFRSGRMGGEFDRMGGRGAENELAQLGLDGGGAGNNLGGLDVNEAAPLILGLAKKLAEQMTAGKGSENERGGMGRGRSDNFSGGGGGMTSPFAGELDPGPSFHFGEGRTKYVRDGQNAGREEDYTGGYTHQGLERGLGRDGSGGGFQSGFGQQNNFGQGRSGSGFGLEGRGFDREGGGGGFGSSGFGGSGSRLGGMGSGLGGGGFDRGGFDRGGAGEGRFGLGGSSFDRHDRGGNLNISRQLGKGDAGELGGGWDMGRQAGGGWGMGREIGSGWGRSKGLGRY